MTAPVHGLFAADLISLVMSGGTKGDLAPLSLLPGRCEAAAGAAKHQGPDGGAPVAIIARRPGGDA